MRRRYSILVAQKNIKCKIFRRCAIIASTMRRRYSILVEKIKAKTTALRRSAIQVSFLFKINLLWNML